MRQQQIGPLPQRMRLRLPGLLRIQPLQPPPRTLQAEAGSGQPLVSRNRRAFERGAAGEPLHPGQHGRNTLGGYAGQRQRIGLTPAAPAEQDRSRGWQAAQMPPSTERILPAIRASRRLPEDCPRIHRPRPGESLQERAGAGFRLNSFDPAPPEGPGRGLIHLRSPEPRRRGGRVILRSRVQRPPSRTPRPQRRVDPLVIPRDDENIPLVGMQLHLQPQRPGTEAVFGLDSHHQPPLIQRRGNPGADGIRRITVGLPRNHPDPPAAGVEVQLQRLAPVEREQGETARREVGRGGTGPAPEQAVQLDRKVADEKRIVTNRV